MPCIACMTKNDGICMGICLPNRDSMLVELKQTYPEFVYSSLVDAADVEVADFYYEHIHLNHQKRNLRETLRREYPLDANARIHVDYVELPTTKFGRNFSVVVLGIDGQDVKTVCHFELCSIGGDGYSVENCKTYLCSGLQMLKIAAMFSGLAKTHVSVPSDLVERIGIEKIQRHNNTFITHTTDAVQDTHAFSALANQQFRDSVTKGLAEFQDLHARLCNEQYIHIGSIEDEPFTKRHNAYFEPIEHTYTLAPRPKI